MEWNFVDSLADSQAILTIRELEENGTEQHKHSCPNCYATLWCEEEMCVAPSVARCGKAACATRST